MNELYNYFLYAHGLCYHAKGLGTFCDYLFDFATCLYFNIPENSPLKIKILTMVAIYCTEVILNIDFAACKYIEISAEFPGFRKKFVILLETVLGELEIRTPQQEVMLVNAQLNFRRVTFAKEKIKVLEQSGSNDTSIIEMMCVLRKFIIIL